MSRLNLEIKRLEEEGQIIPLPPDDSKAQANGTATPTGTPASSQQATVTNAASSITQPARSGTAPLPQRTASAPGVGSQSSSHLGTPTPTGARAGQKRKAAAAFRRDASVDEGAADEDTEVYCFCQQVSYGEMVACDNEHCEREWFHLPCVGLTSPPQGKWYCDECLQKMGSQKQRQTDKKKAMK